MAARAIFFDRDGVVNRRLPSDYVRTPDEFEFIDDIFDVLAEAKAEQWLTVLVTNQRGIARGLMSRQGLEAIHAMMQSELHRRSGTQFDAIYYCPHERDAGCDCRKPLPGMLVRAAHEHAIDCAASWMIGDTESDISAGIAAGCHTIRLELEQDGTTRADLTALTLRAAWELIRSHNPDNNTNSETQSL